MGHFFGAIFGNFDLKVQYFGIGSAVHGIDTFYHSVIGVRKLIAVNVIE